MSFDLSLKPFVDEGFESTSQNFLQFDFPKMRGGSKAVWNFSENSSILEEVGFPKGKDNLQ